MKRIALKIDVDTYRGTLSGVPALIGILQRHNAEGTFFFSLGPDHSGREALSSSLGRYYGLSTRLYGRLLPGPIIGTRCSEILRQASNAGFETGIHAWDRVGWEQKVHQAGNPWIEAEMSKSCACFAEIFAEMPRAHAAAGWRMNRHALRLTQRLGFAYASDCRGNHPFIPVIDGEIVACPQLPTTLPTLDEILMLAPGCTPDQAADRILQLSTAIVGDHVFTLRAELEGMKFCSTFERLISEWKTRGYQLVALREIYSTLDLHQLPLHNVRFADVPGRVGPRMMQGQAFLQD
ncbi:MAG: polysaccharide deacetylase family protein [Propionivibrio sp.]|uniref:polysaccharide deacetylase family protein n=1 Tax=Propionivibrio sp. TaxID=2212460 RepID=UPI001A4B1FC5|nr:polysaccharide deacetylase family protein [Propionivibrio sp.]MBL8413300.1 polysaccharide deacetylase family protein [Propionivibrio sp.]